MIAALALVNLLLGADCTDRVCFATAVRECKPAKLKLDVVDWFQIAGGKLKGTTALEVVGGTKAKCVMTMKGHVVDAPPAEPERGLVGAQRRTAKEEITRLNASTSLEVRCEESGSTLSGIIERLGVRPLFTLPGCMPTRCDPPPRLAKGCRVVGPCENGVYRVDCGEGECQLGSAPDEPSMSPTEYRCSRIDGGMRVELLPFGARK